MESKAEKIVEFMKFATKEGCFNEWLRRFNKERNTDWCSWQEKHEPEDFIENAFRWADQTTSDSTQRVQQRFWEICNKSWQKYINI